MNEQKDVLGLLEELKALEVKLDDLSARAAQIRNTKVDQFRSIRELAISPEVSNKLAKTQSSLAQVKSTADLTNLAIDATNVVSLLEMILLSPHVEEFLAILVKLMTEVELEMPSAAKNWTRNACKDASKPVLDNLTSTTRKIAENLAQLKTLKDQFKPYLNYQLSQLTELKETHTSIISWITEINSGSENLTGLSNLLSVEIRKDAPEFCSVSRLVDFFHKTSIKHVKEGLSHRIKDAPTYWNENETRIKTTWQTVIPRLVSLNSLVGQLLEEETQLLWKYLDAQKSLELTDFDSFLEKLSKYVFSLVDSKRFVQSTQTHVDSIKDVNITDEQVIESLEALRQLQREIANAAQKATLESYCDALGRFSSNYENWKKTFDQMIANIKKEADSWRQVCSRQGLSLLGEKISKLIEGLTEGITIGSVASINEDLSVLFRNIKEELGKQGDPELLDTIIRLQATQGLVTLKDIEEELKKTKPDITRNSILSRVADLETNKLIKIEIKA